MTTQRCQLTDPSLFLSPNFFCAMMARITFLMSLLMTYHALMPIMELETKCQSHLRDKISFGSDIKQCKSAASVWIRCFNSLSVSTDVILSSSDSFSVVSLIVLFSHCSSLLGPVINALTRMGGSFSCWLG